MPATLLNFPELVEGPKCPRCGVFHTDATSTRRSRNRASFSSWCRSCNYASVRERRAQDPRKPRSNQSENAPGGPKCTKCGVLHTDGASTRRSGRLNSFNSWCRVCAGIYNRGRRANDPEKYRAYGREQRTKRPLYRRCRTYGITPADWEKMRAEQENKCAICQQEFVKTPNVDHCHSTGKVRGLLCSVCNVHLPLIENPKTLAAAIEYLKRHS